jgi:membrane protease YdiL (CAAX protease family)
MAAIQLAPPVLADPPRAWRLVLSALLWIAVVVVAFLLVIAGIIAGALGVGLARHDMSFPFTSEISKLMTLVIAAIVIYGGLYLVAVRKARLLGGGDVRRGLGFGPIARPGLVAMFGALLIVIVTLYLTASAVSPAFRAFFSGTQPTPLPHESLAGNILFGAFWLIAVLCAPVVEELYFRGWLWTGLRQTLSPAATSVITGGLWLLCHLDEGLTRPLALLPAAIILSVVRHRSGSVRATIAVHFTNNLFAFLVLAVLAAVGK